MRWNALGRLGSVSACLLLALSCRERAKPKQDFPTEPVVSGEIDPNDLVPREGAGGAAAAPVEGVPRCRVVSGSGFLLGSRGKEELGSEEPVDVPFAVDLGNALLESGGFVVGALVPQGKTVEARAVWLPSDAKRAVVSSFGVVQGGGPAPALTLNSGMVLAAILDSNSSGKILQLASVATPSAEPVVRLGAAISVSRDDSDAFSLATAGAQSLLVWDDLDKKPKPHSVIRAVLLTPANLDKPGKPFQISPPFLDVEAPRLLSRGDGYWLVWSKSEGTANAHPKAELTQADAGVPEEVPWVDTEMRTLQAVMLSAEGKPQGKPVEILPPVAKALSYECSVDGAGGIVVVFREEAGLGNDPPHLGVVRLALDGSVVRRSFATPAAPGLPDLLVDPEQKPASLWLAIGDEGSELRLSPLGPEFKEPEFVKEPALGRTRVLAVKGARFLSAEPKGQAIELRTLDCQAPTPQGGTKK
ncbi:MAG: hypothetical protein SFV15_26450 [Polyangiaceae bacterium]|nr:hypothetical protein [Polyangiaceae bacterium]